VPRNTAAVAFVRGSRYEKSFIENTKEYDEIMAPLPQEDERRYKKIKAALTDHSTFADSNTDVQYFTNLLLKQGRKEEARGVVRKTFELIKRTQLEKYHKAKDENKEQIELDPLTVFLKALENTKPELHTVKVVKAGTLYKVPVPCGEKRQRFYAMKWMIESGKDRDKKTHKMHDKLATDLIAAYQHEGSLIAKKQELYRICEMNKMYATLIHRR